MTTEDTNTSAASSPLERPVRLCSHCGMSLDGYSSAGLRHYGTHTAHQESTCLRLLRAEIERLRGEKAVLLRWMGSALAVLATLEGEDSEDGGEELRMLLTAGKRLVCAHSNKKTQHFTYGMRSHCPDCGQSEEAWWD